MCFCHQYFAAFWRSSSSLQMWYNIPFNQVLFHFLHRKILTESHLHSSDDDKLCAFGRRIFDKSDKSIHCKRCGFFKVMFAKLDIYIQNKHNYIAIFHHMQKSTLEGTESILLNTCQLGFDLHASAETDFEYWDAQEDPFLGSFIHSILLILTPITWL